MFYEIENFKKRVGKAKFNLDLVGSLNKNERYFLNNILKKYIKSGEILIKFSKDELIDLLKIDLSEINLFLNRLSKKYVKYDFEDFEDEVSGGFNLIDSYFISSKEIVINLPRDIKHSKSIKLLYSFTNRITYKFYGYYLKNFITKEGFEVKIDEFKDILNIDNRYERFFDFEKNVLKPILKDLEIPYKLSYEKVKCGSNLNNKVVSIEFKFLTEELGKDDDMKLKSVLFIIKNDIEDIQEVYTVLKNGIQNHGYDLTYKTCFKVKQRYKSINMSFDELLKIFFKKLDLKDIEPAVIIQKNFLSAKDLRKSLMNELDKIKPGILMDTSFFCEKFLQDLILLKDDKILSFKNNEMSIFISWKSKGESVIKIFLA